MKLRNLVTYSLLLFSSLLISACSMPFKDYRLDARPEGNDKFSGIKQLVTSNRNVDVFMIHGMCSKDRDWATENLKRLNKELGGVTELEISEIPVKNSNAKLFQATIGLPDGAVKASALWWSPIVEPLKLQLCYDQTKKSKICERSNAENHREYQWERASINRFMKDSLLNDCLADALIYQGKSRDSIV